MKRTAVISFAFVLACFSILACKSNHGDTEKKTLGKIHDAKSSYGQAVERSQKMSDESDARNEEMKRQADALDEASGKDE